MLTQTLRRMERDGLVTRTVHPVVPPHVDYALAPLGETLGEAFCGSGSGRRPIATKQEARD
jgi:DNA-binding HxlR family transcriptional regulator